MDVDGTINLLILALGVTTTAAVGFAIAWIRARDRARQAERRLTGDAPEEIGAARVEQLEHSLEAMARQLERLSEGQRFTTDLLSKRAAPHDDPPR